MVEHSKIQKTSQYYEKLGLRAGLEVHAQINSNRKLFCHCKPKITPPKLSPDYTFERRFRPVLGEMGDYDAGMVVEFEKDYQVIYFTFPPPYDVCSYEFDETPPFLPDPEAIDTGFFLARYYNCQSLVDEVVFNRKQYLDGSITTGFQRTAVLGRDGYILLNGKKIRISNFNVEEDAARRVNFVDRTNRTVYFNLDRLSFPLVEIITNHEDCNNPQDLADLARLIGLGLRATRKGVRGIGSIRQDVNISIKRGDRAELKGVQDLKKFQIYVDREIQRQMALIRIMDQLNDRDIDETDFEHFYYDVSKIIDNYSDLRRNNDWEAFGIRLPKCAGILKQIVQPGRSFGIEVCDKAELISGLPIKQMFNSDENPEWMSSKAYAKFFEVLGLENEDAFFVTVGPTDKAIHALKKIIERMKMALSGVPKETRRVLENGNSEFLRVIHGKDRLYPDTDTAPIPIVPERLKKIFAQEFPPKLWDILALGELTLHELSQIVRNDVFFWFFLELTEKLKIPTRKTFGIIQKVRKFAKTNTLDTIKWKKTLSQIKIWLETNMCSLSDTVWILEDIMNGVHFDQIENSFKGKSELLERISRFIEEKVETAWFSFEKSALFTDNTELAIRKMMFLITRSFHSFPKEEVIDSIRSYWKTWNTIGG